MLAARKIRLSQCSSARCSIEEGDHNEGKQLNFIQHDARVGLLPLFTVQQVLSGLQSPSDNLCNGAIADCFEC